MIRTKLYTVRYANAITGEPVETIEMSDDDTEAYCYGLTSCGIHDYSIKFSRFADEPRDAEVAQAQAERDAADEVILSPISWLRG